MAMGSVVEKDINIHTGGQGMDPMAAMMMSGGGGGFGGQNVLWLLLGRLLFGGNCGGLFGGPACGAAAGAAYGTNGGISCLEQMALLGKTDNVKDTVIAESNVLQAANNTSKNEIIANQAGYFNTITRDLGAGFTTTNAALTNGFFNVERGFFGMAQAMNAGFFGVSQAFCNVNQKLDTIMCEVKAQGTETRCFVNNALLAQSNAQKDALIQELLREKACRETASMVLNAGNMGMIRNAQISLGSAGSPLAQVNPSSQNQLGGGVI